MQYKITAPQQMKGIIQLPASKSISNRALILHALSGGTVAPQNLADCDDTNVMIAALTHNPHLIDIKAAGTAMRFLTAYYALANGEHTITGTARMQQRPIRILVDALRELGAEIAYTTHEGYPPLHIVGSALQGGTIALPGDVSSQYISALLMIGAMLPDGLTLQLTGNIVSRPYINLTLQLMRDYGGVATWCNDSTIAVKPIAYRPTPFVVESDWSAASYWYEMCALAPQAEIELCGLFEKSYQGDAAVAHLFEQLGVSTTFHDGGVTLHKGNATVSRMVYDFVNQPDLAQTFVVTCALMNVPFHFTGLQSLKIKETDRIAALICELRKLGYAIGEAHNSELFWQGERCAADEKPTIDTYEDHRMAMAFAPAAMVIPALHINNPEVVSKSYPTYWEHLAAAGFTISAV